MLEEVGQQPSINTSFWSVPQLVKMNNFFWSVPASDSFKKRL